jgi:hypothetical protein
MTKHETTKGEMKQLTSPTLGRRFSAISLVLAPLFLLLSTLVLPSLPSDPGGQLDLASARHGGYYAFVIFGIVGSIFLLPAVLAIMETVRASRPRLGVIAGGLALFGSALALVDWGSNLVMWQMGVPGADRAQMVALVSRFDETVGSGAITQISGVTFLVGIVALAVGLRRDRVVPLWASTGLVAGTFLNLVGFAAGQVVVLDISGVILVAAMASIAWHTCLSHESAPAVARSHGLGRLGRSRLEGRA